AARGGSDRARGGPRLGPDGDDLGDRLGDRDELAGATEGLLATGVDGEGGAHARALDTLLDHAALTDVERVVLALGGLVGHRLRVGPQGVAAAGDGEGDDAVRPGADDDVVELAERDACKGEDVVDVGLAVGRHADGLPVDDDVDGCAVDERHVEGLSAAVPGAGGGDGDLPAGLAEGGDGLAGGLGGGPHRPLLAVDVDADLPGATDDDEVAVLERGVGLGPDGVVLTEGDVLLLEQALDGAGEGRHGLLDAVDVELDGLVGRGDGDTAAGGDGGRGQGRDEGAAPAALARRV